MARWNAVWLLLVVLSIPASAQDLTGTWRGNDGGTYQIAQHGSNVWWYGRSADAGRSWRHVFYGSVIASGVVGGQWADLPSGRLRNSGTLTIRIVGDNLVTHSQTGGFGGTQWSRIAESDAGGECVSATNVGGAISTMAPKPQEEGVRYTQANTSYMPGGVDQWFSDSASVLQRVIIGLGGDDAWNQYNDLETNKLKIDADINKVAARMQFIKLLLR